MVKEEEVRILVPSENEHPRRTRTKKFHSTYILLEKNDDIFDNKGRRKGLSCVSKEYITDRYKVLRSILSNTWSGWSPTKNEH